MDQFLSQVVSPMMAAVGYGLPDALGLVGLVLYIGSYLALQLGLIRGDGYLYPSLNLAAAASFIVSLIEDFNLYVILGEIIWIAISIIGITRIYVVHTWLSLSPEERAAAARLVPSLPKDRVRRLLERGAWIDAPPGQVLATEGRPVTHLVFIASGTCGIDIGGELVASVGAGALIGEMTYHTGAPATATVVVATPARVLAFERTTLATFLKRNEDIGAALERSIAGDLRGKLAATSRALAEGRRDGKAPSIT